MPVRRQPVIGPGALGVALDEPGIGQKLEMARNAGLALVEDFGEILDRMVAIGQKRKQAQPGAFPRRLQYPDQFVQSAHRALRYKDIFIFISGLRSSAFLRAWLEVRSAHWRRGCENRAESRDGLRP